MNKIRPTTREAILEAAFQVFKQNHGASLADVAKRAGVGRATLHRQFNSRKILMVALAHTAIEELRMAVDKGVTNAVSHSDGLKRTLTATIPLAHRQWFLTHERVAHDPAIAAKYKADQKALCDSIDQAMAEGTFDPTIPTQWIALTFDAQIYNAWTMVIEGHSTPDQAADLAWRTLTRGLGVPT